jgi:hypothetical protein
MRTVPRPLNDDAATYDNIAAAKRGARKPLLVTLRPRIIAAYQQYRAVAPNLLGLAPISLTDAEQEALRHAYNASTLAFDDLREKLFEPIEVALCAHCNMTEAYTLDHYLPKRTFPEFSTLSLNLLPACGKCNSSKSDAIVAHGSSVRAFLHAYYDTLPDENFLLLDMRLKRDGLGLTYRLHKPSTMPQPLYQQLDSHFSLLDLNDRYRVNALSRLRGRYRGFSRLYGSAARASKVRRALHIEADSLAGEFGHNHWEAVLYKTLASSDEFCDGGFKVVGRMRRALAA